MPVSFVLSLFFCPKIISPLPALHLEQDVMRLSKVALPFLERGILWSTTSFAPSCGVLPQYWQVKLSLSKILYRNLKGVFSLFLGLPVGQLGFIGKPANNNALPQVPNRLSYKQTPGKLSNFFNVFLVTKPPSREAASLSIFNNFSSEIRLYFVRYLYFFTNTL